MKKRDLKKLALMGLTTGLLITCQAAHADDNGGQGTEQSADVSEAEILSQLSLEGQQLYHELDTDGKLLAKLVAGRGCGCGNQGKISFARSYGGSSCGGGGSGGCGGGDRPRGYNGASCGGHARQYQSDSSSGIFNEDQGTMNDQGYPAGRPSGSAAMSDEQIKAQLTPDNRRIFDGLSAEGKKQVKQFCSGQANCDLNAAVRSAATKDKPSGSRQTRYGLDAAENVNELSTPSSRDSWSSNTSSSPVRSDEEVRAKLTSENRRLYDQLTTDEKKKVRQSNDPNAAVKAVSTSKASAKRTHSSRYNVSMNDDPMLDRDIDANDDMDDDHVRDQLTPENRRLYDQLSADKKQRVRDSDDPNEEVKALSKNGNGKSTSWGGGY